MRAVPRAKPTICQEEAPFQDAVIKDCNIDVGGTFVLESSQVEGLCLEEGEVEVSALGVIPELDATVAAGRAELTAAKLKKISSALQRS